MATTWPLENHKQQKYRCSVGGCRFPIAISPHTGAWQAEQAGLQTKQCGAPPHLGEIHTNAQRCKVHTALVQPDAHHQQQRDDHHKRHDKQPRQVGTWLAVHIQAIEVLGEIGGGGRRRNRVGQPTVRPEQDRRQARAGELARGRAWACNDRARQPLPQEGVSPEELHAQADCEGKPPCGCVWDAVKAPRRKNDPVVFSLCHPTLEHCEHAMPVYPTAHWRSVSFPPPGHATGGLHARYFTRSCLKKPARAMGSKRPPWHVASIGHPKHVCTESNKRGQQVRHGVAHDLRSVGGGMGVWGLKV